MPQHSLSRTRRRPGLHGAAAVAVVLVLAGFLFSANARISGHGAGRTAQDLPSLVQVEMDRAEQLATEVQALREDVDSLTDAMTQGPPSGDPRQAALVEFAAGRVAAVGPGLTVRLTDAPTNAPRPDWVLNDDLVVHQQDLQAVINALWAGGAEAMTLQDQRVISTSAFRCVGNVLLLHGRHYSPPYVVRAIGDPEQMQEALLASPAIQRYLEYVSAVGLGWSVTVEEQVHLPAYEGGLQLQHASSPEGLEPDEATA